MSEILDTGEHGGIEDLVTACTAFNISAACGHVSKVDTRLNIPCEACGVNVEMRESLFGWEQQILRTIFDCYQSDHSRAVCVLLFCALFEQHLRKLVSARCRRVGIQPRVIDFLLDGNRRVSQLLSLFENLTGSKLKEAVKDSFGGQLFSAYERLKTKRNRLAHGVTAASFEITTQDIQDAMNYAAGSFSVFADLFHRFCAADSPPLPSQ